MRSPTRVALVVPGVSIGAHGGVESVAKWLYQRLAEDDAFEVDLFSTALSSRDRESFVLRQPATGWHKPVESRGQAFGAHLRHFGVWGADFEAARMLPPPGLQRALEGYNIVQVVAGTPAFGGLVATCTSPVCLQVATTVKAERRRDHVGSTPRSGATLRRISTALVARLEPWAVRRAQHVFVENEWMMREVMQWTHSSRVSLAPPGIDTSSFRVLPHDDQPLQEQYLLSVGRLNSARKNFAGLIEAYRTAVDSYGLQRRLHIMGGGDPGEVRELALRAGLADRITITANASAAELSDKMARASAFVLASHEEGLGLVYLEALASGLPLVATATEGAKHIFSCGDVGILCSLFPAGSRAFAQAMADVQSTRVWDGRALRRIVEDNFGNDVAFHRFTQVYERLRNAMAVTS